MICRVDADKSLYDRLCSMGIIAQEIVEVKEYSLAKSTLSISMGDFIVALRLEEARHIEVKKVE